MFQKKKNPSLPTFMTFRRAAAGEREKERERERERRAERGRVCVRAESVLEKKNPSLPEQGGAGNVGHGIAWKVL
jgi:hypothetical protein